MFEQLGISRDLVQISLPAMNKHSQNDFFFDRSKARKLTQKEITDSDKMLTWLDLPLNTTTAIEDYVKLVQIKWTMFESLLCASFIS